METSKYNYKNLAEWKKAEPKAFDAAYSKNLLEIICEKFRWKLPKNIFKFPKGYWTLERCKEDALKYKIKTIWRKNSFSCYNISCKNNWLEECCTHMTSIKLPSGYWTLERCKEDALKYKTQPEWKKNSSGYHAARTNKWHYECCAHMISISLPKGYWTLERCKEDALKYKTKTEWVKKNSSGYCAASKNKWLDECCVHMIIIHLPSGYWTLERCKEDALKYKTKTEWGENSAGYCAARKNKWINECCAHMKLS